MTPTAPASASACPDEPAGAAVAIGAFSRSPDAAADLTRTIAVELPVSIEFNGLAYAVMMATPADLEDFAYGFALAEGVIADASDIVDVDTHRAELGWILRIQIADRCAAPVRERIRRRVADGGCGLCGVENLEQALRQLPAARTGPHVDAAALFRALGHLRPRQLLNEATGAVHGAAFCAPDGTILAIREDVGRHNAFDKLAGTLIRGGTDPATGFALLTSRCSYELVDKAVTAGFSTLATISAPTSLAVERARRFGLTLVALARADAFLVLNDPQAMFAVTV